MDKDYTHGPMDKSIVDILEKDKNQAMENWVCSTEIVIKVFMTKIRKMVKESIPGAMELFTKESF